MTARRTKREDGRYTVTFTHEGKRYFGYGKTQALAKANADSKRERLLEGAPVRDSGQSLGKWLIEWQRDLLPQSDRKATTQENYGWMLAHVHRSDVAKIPLARLLPSDFVRLMGDLAAQGLADSTRRSCYAAVRAALDDAVANKLIRENPLSKVKRPSGQAREESRALEAAEVALFLEHARALRYFDAYRLALGTGMRRGELAGLQWSDVDLERGTLTIRSNLVRVGRELVVTSPKSKRSRRTLRLNAGCVALLKAHKAEQAAERLAVGNLWQETGFVFVTSIGYGRREGSEDKRPGNPVDPANLSRGVRIAVRKAGLTDEGGKIGIHTLRHTFATIKLLDGVPLHVVSRLLGHGSIDVTADLYGHLTDTASDDAMERGSAALGF